MKIPARRVIKATALIVHRPLKPLLDALGFDAKASYELAYWRSRQIEEGELANDWYESIFTTWVGLERSFYADKRLLDVGSGPRGSLEWADHAAERVCLDPLVDRYRSLGIERHQATYCHAPAERIPYPDGHFDVVSSINSLDHVDDVERAGAEICRVLAPGGLLLMVVEIHPRPTIAEPHVLPWDFARKLGQGTMEVIEEAHLERPASGHYLEQRTPFDHSDPRPRNGILLAKLTKRAAARRPDG